MGNYPNVKYGNASAGAAGGGGGGDPVWVDVGGLGTTIGVIGKDVWDRDLVDGASTKLTVSPAEVVRDLPGDLRYEVDPGPPPVLFEGAVTDVLLERLGVDPAWDGSTAVEGVWVSVDDLTQISFTSLDACADIGTIPLQVWVRYDDGASYSIMGALVQFVVEDAQGLCAGP